MTITEIPLLSPTLAYEDNRPQPPTWRGRICTWLRGAWAGVKKSSAMISAPAFIAASAASVGICWAFLNNMTPLTQKCIRDGQCSDGENALMEGAARCAIAAAIAVMAQAHMAAVAGAVTAGRRPGQGAVPFLREGAGLIGIGISAGGAALMGQWDPWRTSMATTAASTSILFACSRFHNLKIAVPCAALSSLLIRWATGQALIGAIMPMVVSLSPQRILDLGEAGGNVVSLWLMECAGMSAAMAAIAVQDTDDLLMIFTANMVGGGLTLCTVYSEQEGEEAGYDMVAQQQTPEHAFGKAIVANYLAPLAPEQRNLALQELKDTTPSACEAIIKAMAEQLVQDRHQPTQQNLPSFLTPQLSTIQQIRARPTEASIRNFSSYCAVTPAINTPGLMLLHQCLPTVPETSQLSDAASVYNISRFW